MRVYRVENEKGDGPYRYKGPLADEMSDAHGYGSGRPTTFTDECNYHGIPPGSVKAEEHLRCGFDSERKLRWWFYGFLTRLRQCGYAIAIYEVPKKYIWHGASGKQLTFDVSKARKVGVA